ncbi:MAG: PAS domain S-box protein, partial [Acidobacteriota bacterium]
MALATSAGPAAPTPTVHQAGDRDLIVRSFHASPVSMGVLEVRPDDLCLVTCNGAAAELLGLSPELAGGTLLGTLPLPEELFGAWLESGLHAWRAQATSTFQVSDPRTTPPRRLGFSVTPLALDPADDRWLCSFRIEDAERSAWLEAAPRRRWPSEVEAHFRHIADTVPVLVWTCDTQGERNFFNRSWQELTGRRPEELVNRGWAKDLHPDDREPCLERVLDAFHGREPFQLDYRLRRHDGVYRRVLDSGVPRFRSDGRFLGYVGSCVDVTRQHQTEDRLRLSERWYRELIEGTDNLVMQIGADGRFTFVNQVSRDVYGAEPEECIGFPFLDFVHPDDHDETRRRFERWTTGRYSCVSFENRQISRSGEVRDVLWTVNPHYDDEGQLTSASCIGKDITERKRSERVHKIQSQVLESMTEGVVLTNAEGFILYTNPAQDDMFGYGPGELMGQHLRVLGGAPLDSGLDDVRRTLEEHGAWAGEVHHQRKDGGNLVSSVRVTVIDIDGVVHWVSVFEDISERRRAEAERSKLDRRLQQAQKLESLGVLAGGIAHDFNNLLMVILGNASLALQDLGAESTARSDIEQIESAAMRAAELTKQMLAYSGRGHFLVEPTDLSQVVGAMEHLLNTTLGGDVDLRFELRAGLPKVEVDIAQLRQLVLNLVTNASEALESGGRVTVMTGYRHYAQAELESAAFAEVLPEGYYVFLKVLDDGVGMEEDVRARVFDPFFTTKFTGRGLGLAAVLGIVRGHSGGIEVESRPGDGTGVTVLLPCSAPPAAAAAPPPETNDMPDADGTILVVDDDTNVLAMTSRMLGRLGFRVLAAEGGAEALETYARNLGEIDLVILDLSMPRMDGEET